MNICLENGKKHKARNKYIFKKFNLIVYDKIFKNRLIRDSESINLF